MATDWQTSSIGDHVDLVTGEAFQSARFGNVKGAGTLLARGDNIKEGCFEWGDKARYWPEMSIELEKYLLREGDVLIGMDGSKVGKNWVRVQKKDLPCLLVQRVARLRTKPSMDQMFLRYLVGNPQFSGYVERVRTGTSIPHISGGQIKSYSILLPPLDVQKQIARVLGDLDEKIELNRQMNETLEALAQTLFKNWFVDGTKLLKGWHKETLGEVATNASESFNFSKFTEVVFVNTGDVLSGDFLHSNRISKIGLPGQAKKAIRQNDILFSEIRPGNRRFAFVDFQPSDYVVSTKFMVIRASDKIEPRILFRVLTTNEALDEFQIEAESRSGTFPQITFDSISRFKIIVPPIELQRAFVQEVAPLEARIKSNKEESRTLAALRDALLPKLLSGELRVPFK